MKISVIVPAYNIEKYIGRCLDSLVCQTIDKLEIIVVNDGSTDNTEQIIKEYEAKYSFVKLITQENAGLSEARNTGIKHSTGKFIHFCDGDDYIKRETAYEELYNAASSKDVDILIFDHYLKKISDKQEKMSLKTLKPFKHLQDLSKPEDRVKLVTFGIAAWNKIFKSSFLKDNDIKFLKRALFEDIPFYWEVILKAQTLIYYKKPFYVYSLRKGSITQSEFSLVKMAHIYNNLDYIDILMKSNPKYMELYSESFKAFKLKVVYQDFFKLSKENRKKSYAKSVSYLKGVDLFNIKGLSLKKKLKYYFTFKLTSIFYN